MNWPEQIEKMVSESTKLAAIEALISSLDAAWMKKLLQMRPTDRTFIMDQEQSDFLAARMQLAVFYSEQLAETKLKYPRAAAAHKARGNG